jgi:hypothetical protein
VEDLLDCRYFRIVEDVILVVPHTNRPIVPGVDGPFVDYGSNQSVLLFPEDLELIVDDGIAVFDLFALEVFEAIQVYD